MMQLQSREQSPTLITSVKPTSETINKALVVPVTSNIAHWLINILDPLGRHLLMPLYFRRLQVIGREHIPQEGPVILAPTHRSRWDGLAIAYAAGKPITGRDLRFMVSQDEMQGIQGWLIRRMGGFPVNTKQPAISSIRHSVELLRSGEVLVMFPEGNIFHHGYVNPLKPGMARIAMQVECSQPGIGLKIVPISIRYSNPIPHWRSSVTINIGTPLEVGNYCTKSGKKSAQKLTSDLETALINLDRNYP